MEHLAWRTSTYTEDGQDCVEVAPTRTGVLLRDTKDHGSGPVIAFSAAQWAAFLAEVAADSPSVNGAAVVEPSASGVVLHGPAGARLAFTPSEWAAFRSGVLDGEFAGLVPA